uniref:Uncharacterized protein n=1 Tax=Anopheles dirus TaxID=7168 RepID=A0A182NTH0_9DIPT
MDARDPYRPLTPLPEYIPDEPNEMLAYAPSGLYPDVALPLALEQLLGARGGAGGGGGVGAGGSVLPAVDPYAYEDAGEWMNGWTEPSVDYMGIPMADLDALSALNDGKGYGGLNGYTPLKRFMVSKKKRSVTQPAQPNAAVAQGCKVGDATCATHQASIQAAA